MNIVRIVAVAAALGALSAGATLAGDPDDPQKDSKDSPRAEGAAASATQAGAESPKGEGAQAKRTPELARIVEEGAKVPEEKRQRTNAAIHTVGMQIDQKAQADGSSQMAERIASEFGLETEAVLATKKESGASWGNLFIAHTLAATGETTASPRELLSLHEQGTGWGQISAGVGLPLGQALKAVQDESRVAMGLEKADGHVLKQLKSEKKTADTGMEG